LSSKFRLAEHVVCRKTNSELRMLFDRSKGVMYELNEAAAAVVERLDQEPGSADAVSESLLAEFDGPPDEIRADVDRLLADFVEAGLLVEE
jgi:PqqD family protein of HPr-rel-A system